ncbi:tripartite ATP-independent transporter DctM subunit [Comamonas sp. BIGb0124]|uniref:TRAP transporter large permease n=1 Tax=Comamonas sp. BIGb0124 TaxID=2485130 RepID=UPI000F4970FD|nr:TRAP transporter large permease [Comamonas sp. BIGb0124]ROR22583.1 tripartite ATP-independent transporter DctM subunit [Comamonas sp. BIGb0124]
MIATLLFTLFIAAMAAGVPIAAAIGLAGMAAIALANADAQWLGLMAVPQNFYAGLGKYPLLAIPMFVLVGSIFDRSGVASRLVNLAVAVVGRGPGMLPLVAISVAMFLGGISGSGPATAAAVGAVMIAAMTRAGYPRAYSASVVGAAAATDILIPPSVAFIVYSVLVPGASVPALFAAGMVPGILVGLALIVPAVWLARRHRMGQAESTLPRPPLWASLRESVWGLAAPVLILGGMRLGWFTPTEAAVVAVFYGLFIGMVVHRTIRVRDLYVILREAGETSAVILLVVALAGIFAYSLSTLGVIDPLTRAIVHSGLGEGGVMALIVLLLIVAGMFLDGISIFLIFVPLLLPIVQHFQWDVVWFGVILTLMVALGQFTPPLAVNLMVSCRIANVPIEHTVRWVGWLLVAVLFVTLLVVLMPQLALWLPAYLGY